MRRRSKGGLLASGAAGPSCCSALASSTFPPRASAAVVLHRGRLYPGYSGGTAPDFDRLPCPPSCDRSNEFEAKLSSGRSSCGANRARRFRKYALAAAPHPDPLPRRGEGSPSVGERGARHLRAVTDAAGAGGVVGATTRFAFTLRNQAGPSPFTFITSSTRRNGCFWR